MSWRADENLSLDVKNKLEWTLPNGNVSVCLSDYIETKRKACPPFLLSSSVRDEGPGEIADGESMAFVMFAVRLHRL